MNRGVLFRCGAVRFSGYRSHLILSDPLSRPPPSSVCLPYIFVLLVCRCRRRSLWALANQPNSKREPQAAFIHHNPNSTQKKTNQQNLKMYIRLQTHLKTNLRTICKMLQDDGIAIYTKIICIHMCLVSFVYIRA